MGCVGVRGVLVGICDRVWGVVVDYQEDEVNTLDTGTTYFVMSVAFPVFCFYVTLLMDWWLSKDDKGEEEDE